MKNADTPSAHVVARATAVARDWAASRLGVSEILAVPGEMHSVRFELATPNGTVRFAFVWVYPDLTDLPGIDRIICASLDDMLRDGQLDDCEIWWSGAENELSIQQNE